MRGSELNAHTDLSVYVLHIFCVVYVLYTCVSHALGLSSTYHFMCHKCVISSNLQKTVVLSTHTGSGQVGPVVVG